MCIRDRHEDDEQVEIVEFSSSQIESDGLVIGYYDGNRREGTIGQTAVEPEATISARKTNLVQAKATPSNVCLLYTSRCV